MDEENAQVTEATPEGGGAAPATPEYSEAEERALSQGWVPKDQFTGNGKWRDAEEFLDRGELFGKIDDLNRRNKNLDTTVKQLSEHYQKVQKTEYDKAIATLRAEKKAALDDGDSSRVVEIDDEIADKREEARTAADKPVVQPPVDEPPNPQLVAWANRNKWYADNRAMKVYADDVAAEMVYRTGEKNPTKILEEVERRVKKEFPEKFNNPNRDKPGSVEGGTSKGRTNTESFQLSAEETMAMNRFVKVGALTKEQYIKDIKEQRAKEQARRGS